MQFIQFFIDSFSSFFCTFPGCQSPAVSRLRLPANPTSLSPATSSTFVTGVVGSSSSIAVNGIAVHGQPIRTSSSSTNRPALQRSVTAEEKGRKKSGVCGFKNSVSLDDHDDRDLETCAAAFSSQDKTAGRSGAIVRRRDSDPWMSGGSKRRRRLMSGTERSTHGTVSRDSIPRVTVTSDEDEDDAMTKNKAEFEESRASSASGPGNRRYSRRLSKLKC